MKQEEKYRILQRAIIMSLYEAEFKPEPKTVNFANAEYYNGKETRAYDYYRSDLVFASRVDHLVGLIMTI